MAEKQSFGSKVLSWFGPIGAVAAPVLDFLGRRQQNRAQAAEARRAEAFSERMSSTQVQRRKADLEAAGFNPALAFGDAASSPGGVQAQIGNELGNVVSSAQAARAANASLNMVVEQLKTQQQTTKAVTESARKAKADADMADLDRNKKDMEMKVWSALASGQKMNMDSPLVKAIMASFETTALQPQSIEAANSAAAANARATNIRADIDKAEADFLKTMDIGDGKVNLKKIIDWIVMLSRGGRR